VLPDGRLTVCDPLLAVVPEAAEPLPGGLPPGEHEVEVLLVDDPAGGERVQTAYLFVGEGEAVEWEPAASVPVDSGVICFAQPGAAQTLVGGGEEMLGPLQAALARSAAPTWEHAAMGGVIAFSAGFGDGVLQVFWGYDAEETLAAVVIECLPDAALTDPGSPGRGLQHAYLAPALFGVEGSAENVIALPPEANRALSAVERKVVRALVEGHDVELEVGPEFASDDDRVPVRVHVRAAGSAGIDEMVEVRQPQAG
jgi:hypothetical protein